MSDAVAVRISLPPVLVPVTAGERELVAEGRTVGEALRDLARRRPALALHLFDDAGALRRHIVCICDLGVVRAHEVDGRPVSAGQEIRICNALAGG